MEEKTATIVPFEERLKERTGRESASTVQAWEVPPPPAWLTPLAKKHWPELAESLQKHKIINELDVDILAIYCSTIARFIEADIKLEEDGLTQQTQNGYSQLTAAYVAWRDLATQTLKFARQLGLTPPARIQMKLGDPNQTDIFDEL